MAPAQGLVRNKPVLACPAELEQWAGLLHALALQHIGIVLAGALGERRPGPHGPERHESVLVAVPDVLALRPLNACRPPPHAGGISPGQQATPMLPAAPRAGSRLSWLRADAGHSYALRLRVTG